MCPLCTGGKGGGGLAVARRRRVPHCRSPALARVPVVPQAVCPVAEDVAVVRPVRARPRPRQPFCMARSALFISPGRPCSYGPIRASHMARPLGFISDSSWNPYTGCTRGAIGRRVTRGGPHPQNARAGTNDCCCRTPAATRAASGSPPPTPSSAAATEASFAAATEALSAATPLPLTCAGGAAAAPPAPPGSARAHSAYLPRLRREPRGVSD